MTATSALKQDALEQIRALLQIPSVNTGDPATIGNGETRAARYVQERLEEVGYETTFVEPVPGRGSVLARLKGSDPQAGALVVHAHLDVVPVAEADWTYPPFAAEIVEGVLYGRGVLDMKGFAGTILAVARAFAREGIVPRRDLIFAFFADEESGGRNGARWLVANRPQLFAGATEALGEVGGFSVPFFGRRAYLVAVGEKGSLGATLVARGHAAHASRPTADNAIVRLARSVAAVADLRFPVAQSPALTQFLDAARVATGRVEADGDFDELLSELGLAASLINASARVTVSPTVLTAGDKRNVIPATAKAELDIRVPPGQHQLVRDAIEAAVSDWAEVVWRHPSDAIEAPIDTPLLGVLQDAISTEDPDGIVVPYQLPAATDNKALAQLGINGYGFTPLLVPDDFDAFGEFHAADERAPVSALAFSASVTARILRHA